jgi:hypothetical protein
MLVVRGQKVGSVTFKNPESARAWARSIGIPAVNGRKKKSKQKRKQNVWPFGSSSERKVRKRKRKMSEAQRKYKKAKAECMKRCR